MQIRFTVRWFDYFLFSFFHVYTAAISQFAAAGFSYIAFHASDGYPLWQRLVSALGIYVLYWAGLALMLMLQTSAARTKGILGPRTLHVRDDGLFVDSPQHQALSYWASIERIVTRPGYIAVYLNSLQAHLIPNGAFPDPAHRAQFLDALRQRLLPAKLDG
ncbi:MAG TPA: YcxB family protein [Telluria sp.]|jgi:hypothetical protein